MLQVDSKRLNVMTLDVVVLNLFCEQENKKVTNFFFSFRVRNQRRFPKEKFRTFQKRFFCVSFFIYEGSVTKSKKPFHPKPIFPEKFLFYSFYFTGKRTELCIQRGVEQKRPYITKKEERAISA